MRVCVGLLGVLAGAFAHGQASFDLIVRLDEFTRRVDRIDGDTGIALGGFSLPFFTSGIVVDQSTGTFLTVSSGNFGSALQRYSIWNGALVSSVAIESPGGLFKLGEGAPGEVILSLETGIRRVNTTTGATVGVPIRWSTPDFSYRFSRAAYLSNGEYAATGETDGSPFSTDRVMLFNEASTWLASSTMSGKFTDVVSRDLASSGTRMLHAWYNAFTGLDTLDLLTRSGGSLTRATLGTYSTIDFEQVLWGHGTDAYVLATQINGSADYLMRIDTVTGQIGPTVSLPEAIEYSADIFLAPEPGSLTALGLGVVAMLRRRRKQLG